MSVLSVQDVGKAFRGYRSEWHRFARWLGMAVTASEETWVLRHVSFDIHPGEAIGIIGRNGAGKSTLLKIITGTMGLTEGQVRAGGRVAAILELGTGFNPELTGRANARHAAGLMGVAPERIDAAISEIEAFAEIGGYFDEPVRTYSSGMQMRVAFAVATAWRPDILIVDEALSVGDAYFQHKCFDRIREFQRHGMSLLLVSHDRGAVVNLCRRAILLDKGRVLKDGDPEAVFDFYNAFIAEKARGTVAANRLGNGRIQTVSGTGEASVQEIALYDHKGEPTEHVAIGESVQLRVRVRVHRAIDSLVLGYAIKDRLGQVMYGTNTWHTGQVIRLPRPGDEFVFVIAFPVTLGVGSYSVQVALVDRDTHLTANYEWRDLALIFHVVNLDKNNFIGCLWNEPRIVIASPPR